MFPSEVYVERRKRLKQQIGSGMILFLGNDESPMNYRDNGYHYRQDSSFLYYFGLDFPGLAALIDVDADEETLFGDDYTIDQIVWMGPQPTIRERGETCGVANTVPAKQLGNALQNALHQERRIHFLPQYRAENLLRLEALLGLHPRRINDYVSESLIMAVAAQRSVKSDLELAEIEHALEITREMHVTAMQMTRPGVYEREVAGRMEGIALAHGGRVA
ncbi:MAG: aminopeptidase P N-terminal domain-containing protein, partial [Calditrichaeota bacterium]|nr:aminopeptidase P N-terminal domain-containing protein [Calditrichota bacterium]